jgi:hypothetical protein
MVCEFGMSERLGLVTLHRKGEGEGTFLSELTAADVDAEVKALTDAAYKQAYEICQERRETLVRIAEHLQVVETIDGEELDRLLQEKGLVRAPGTSLRKEMVGTARIAAAEAQDWTEASPGTPAEIEPPVAAS